MPAEEEISDAQLRELVTGALSETLRRLHAKREDDVACAILFLLTRVANTWRTVATLWRDLASDCPETFMVDAGTLVRASFEAYLQAAYIAHEPSESRNLAADYLEFEHIDRHNLVTRLLKHDNYIARALKGSPLRPEGEKRVEAQYQRVKERYLTPSGNVRNKWYKRDLRTIARTLDVEPDYDLFVYAFHPYVHSTAYGLGSGPPVDSKYVLTLASTIAARTAKVALDYLGTCLDEPHQTVLDTLAEGSMDGPPTKPTSDDSVAGPAD